MMKWHIHRYSNFRCILTSTAIMLLLFVTSCSDSDITPAPPAGETYLVDATLLNTVSSLEIKLLAQLSGLGLEPDEFIYDVDIFKITYRTKYLGSDITASGLVVLPKTTIAVAMLSFQHGTIVLQDEAPSNLSPSDPNLLLYGALSSSGFIGVVPDYLGCGASSSILHPYYVAEFTASAIVDMLKAARELAEEKNIVFNTKLFLAGYSEGGYATMAAHKAMEESKPDGFELIASFAGAGGYDITGLQAYFFGLKTYDDPYYLAFLARAYQLTYDYTTILTDLFKEPYASRIPTLFDGMTGASEINAQLTTDITDLLQEGLSSNINTDPAYTYLLDAFAENSLTDWIPETLLYMYHGDSDTTVPYENSFDTYNELLSNGASPNIVTFIPLIGTHSTATTPFILDFIPRLWALR